MKNQVLIIASVCLAMGLAATPSYAQRGGVQAKVPFDFNLSGKTFPAGEYTMIAASQQIRIEDGTGRVIAMALANEIPGSSPEANGKVIFHCYSNRCFLSEVSFPTENGRKLNTSPAEASLQKEQSAAYFVLVGMKPKS